MRCRPSDSYFVYTRKMCSLLCLRQYTNEVVNNGSTVVVIFIPKVVTSGAHIVIGSTEFNDNGWHSVFSRRLKTSEHTSDDYCRIDLHFRYVWIVTLVHRADKSLRRALHPVVLSHILKQFVAIRPINCISVQQRIVCVYGKPN